jgi:hypothetical protein
MLSNDVVQVDESTAADELAREIVTGQPFSPREETGCEGILTVGQPSKRRPEATHSGHVVTAYALKLAPLLFVRPGELRHAEWTEFDLDSGA